MENQIEGVIAIKKDKEVVAMVYNEKGRQIFYTCKEMNTDDVKQLLDNFITNK